MIDLERLSRALDKARQDLLDQRNSQGHWTGRLSSSPLATATAVSALAMVKRCRQSGGDSDDPDADTRLNGLIIRGLRWLVETQNEDGGWGDTETSLSNIATTYLACAAFRLTGVPADDPGLLDRAWRYIGTCGGIAGLRRRYGRDKSFAVPILTNGALAGIVPWREVSALPFELACLPHSLYRFLRLPVVSYAIPALVAIGQAKFHHQKPLNPFTRLLRSMSVGKSLEVLEAMQPSGGGFLEAAPLTSFVVMSLAGIGKWDHAVTQKGVDFLVRSARSDGSWPIDTDLATWNTTLSVNALAAGGQNTGDLGCLDWVLECQQRREHPYTKAAPGGWGWSNLSGAVPDADDTAGALLALHAWTTGEISGTDGERIRRAVTDGVDWLLDLQNADGGWPTFCRGWGSLPFDRSGSDLTAHAMRALKAWHQQLAGALEPERSKATRRLARIRAAMDRGHTYLIRTQRPDGSWVPLWFGNQNDPDEENPVYGTSRVLMGFRDAGLLETSAARRGLRWLVARRNSDGGWGGGPVAVGPKPWRSSVEETALAVEALMAADREGESKSLQTAGSEGLAWLVSAVETGAHRETSPIGFYFAKLWYHEALYPLIFTVSALGQAAMRLLPRSESKSQSAHR